MLAYELSMYMPSSTKICHDKCIVTDEALQLPLIPMCHKVKNCIHESPYLNLRFRDHFFIGHFVTSNKIEPPNGINQHHIPIFHHLAQIPKHVLFFPQNFNPKITYLSEFEDQRSLQAF